jgi:hypothetical protein
LGIAMVRSGARRLLTVVFLASAFVFSFPFRFEYQLGNLEVCIFVILAVAIIAFLRGYGYTAAALIGVAASMKVFPAVYLALFLSRREYRKFSAGLVVAAAMNLLGLWFVCPSISVSYRGIQAGLGIFRAVYMLQYRLVDTGFDHSIFGFIKRVSHVWGVDAMPGGFLTGYLVVAALAGVALYFLIIRRLPLLNQILCLCVAMLLLPPTSHDYTLMHLYVPWGLLVLYAIQTSKLKLEAPGLLAAFVCFGILMSPENELSYGHAGFSGQVKAITLVVLMAIALKRRWELPEGTELARAGLA